MEPTPLYCIECRRPIDECCASLCPARFTKPVPLGELPPPGSK